MDNNKYLFDFEAFLSELSEKESKKSIVDRYQNLVYVNKKIPNNIRSQVWYKNYLSNFKPIPKINVPVELKEDFDWYTLFKLIFASFSSQYRIEEVVDNRKKYNELYITVVSGDNEVEKKISELWSFQILRLFEIYCEEQMNLASLIRENEREAKSIYEERESRVNLFKKKISKRKVESEKNENKKLKKSNDDNQLIAYHYCSLDSAFHIIKSKKMFASDLTYMNDKNEVTFGAECLQIAINKIIKKTSDKEYKEWLMEYFERFNDEYLNDDLVFISCFSKKRDDLNQWRSYGNNGFGICLVFDFNVTLYDSKTDGFTHTEINYLNHKESNTEKFEDFTKYIEKEFFAIYHDYKRNNLNEKINELFEIIPDNIKIDLRFLKNDNFKEEEEFRAVTLNRENKYPIKTRVGKQYIIPYVEMDLTNIKDEFALKEIIVGPSIDDFEKSKKSLEKLLIESNLDITKVKIYKSDIPYKP